MATPTLELDQLDTRTVLDETLAHAIPDTAAREAAIERLLAGADPQRTTVLWCWGPAGYESPSAPLKTALGQSKSLGVELSYRVSTRLGHLLEDGSQPADPVWGEGGRYMRQALDGILAGEVLDAAVDALLDGRSWATMWGWELPNGEVFGGYPRDMAEAKSAGARLWRCMSLQTKPRGHHKP